MESTQGRDHRRSVLVHLLEQRHEDSADRPRLDAGHHQRHLPVGSSVCVVLVVVVPSEELAAITVEKELRRKHGGTGESHTHQRERGSSYMA